MVVSYTIRSQRLETPVLDDSWFRISASISPSDTSHWPLFLKHRAHNVTLMLASVMILHPLDSSNFQERQKGFPYSCSYLYLIYLASVSFIATPRTSFSIPVSLPWFFFCFWLSSPPFLLLNPTQLPLWKTVYQQVKLIICTSHNPTISFSDMYSNNAYTCKQKVCKNIHSIIICKHQKLVETIFINSREGKLWYIHWMKYHRARKSNDRLWCAMTLCWETKCQAKEPNVKEYILSDSVSIKFKYG